MDDFLEYVHKVVRREQPRPPAPIPPLTDVEAARAFWVTQQVPRPLESDFKFVGHTFSVVLFALLGGLLGRYFYATAKTRQRN